MTKLEAINKILTEKLAGTKQGKTLLEALNYVNQTYGGTGDADTMADALEQLYAVFSKGSESPYTYNDIFIFKTSAPSGVSFSGTLNAMAMNVIDIDMPALVKKLDPDANAFGSSLFDEMSSLKKIDITPLKDFKFKTFNYMFHASGIEGELDLSSWAAQDNWINPAYFESPFGYMFNITSIILPVIKNISGARSCFAYCTNLKKIDASRVDFSNYSGSSYSYTMNGCTALEELILNGTFGSNQSTTPAYGNMYLKDCKSLTRDSLVNIFNTIYDRTDLPTSTIKLHADALKRLSDEDKALATNKNYTLTT